MKYVIAYTAVGLVTFITGFFVGRMSIMSDVLTAAVYASGNKPARTSTANEVQRIIQNFGPIVSIGQFTSNLAGAGRHVLDCTLAFELIGKEGALQFAGDIKRSLNRMLPDVDGQAPIVNVLYESMILE